MKIPTWSGLTAIPACLALLCGAGPAGPPQWRSKVSDHVLRQIENGPAEFLVILDEQADLSRIDSRLPQPERGRLVVQTLRDTASRSQSSLLARLQADGLEYRALWVANMIWVRAPRPVLAQIAARPDVRRIDANRKFSLELPIAQPPDADRRSIEWGISLVGADQIWAMGYDGSGIVIAGQDTGYQWDHPSTLNSYRGWDGLTADHNYNWHDAIHAGGGVCGPDSPVPCGDMDHGTHTMGTMVGDDGGSNQIGVAPGARWIGCRNMDVGDGTPLTYSECFQWFLAPTDLNGQNPDPAKAPQIINNSWTCPPSEGCAADTLQTVVENTRSAGILVVVSAGNSGPSCSTVTSPPGVYEAAFSIGATNSGDGIASFSSRGPVNVDLSNRLKPDVSAPGVSVRSAVRGGGYSSFSGTSMAAPHVAGLAALLLDARPDLVGDVDTIEALISGSAVPLTATQDCGLIPGSFVPNHTFGAGRIDAVEMLLGDSDADGVNNLQDCRPTSNAVWSIAEPIDNLSLSQVLPTLFNWTAPSGLGAGATTIDVDLLRSNDPADFSDATCLATGANLVPAIDPEIPEDLFCYLVRSTNSCDSQMGPASVDAPPRIGPDCP